MGPTGVSITKTRYQWVRCILLQKIILVNRKRFPRCYGCYCLIKKAEAARVNYSKNSGSLFCLFQSHIEPFTLLIYQFSRLAYLLRGEECRRISDDLRRLSSASSIYL